MKVHSCFSICPVLSVHQSTCLCLQVAVLSVSLCNCLSLCTFLSVPFCLSVHVSSSTDCLLSAFGLKPINSTLVHLLVSFCPHCLSLVVSTVSVRPPADVFSCFSPDSQSQAQDHGSVPNLCIRTRTRTGTRPASVRVLRSVTAPPLQHRDSVFKRRLCSALSPRLRGSHRGLPVPRTRVPPLYSRPVRGPCPPDDEGVPAAARCLCPVGRSVGRSLDGADSRFCLTVYVSAHAHSRSTGGATLSRRAGMRPAEISRCLQRACVPERCD